MRSAAFSYLPEGTPAWPTTVPQNAPYRTGPDIHSAPLVQNEGSSVHPQNVAKPKKSKLAIPAIVGLFLLSILIGAGLTFGILYANGQRLSFGSQSSLRPVQLPTRSTSSTPASLTPTTQASQLPTPTAFQIANSKELGVSLKFPSDWIQDKAQTTASGNTSVGFHPQKTLPVSMYVAKLSSSVSSQVTDTTEVNQANIQGFGSNNNLLNFKVLTDTPQHRTIGGIDWDEQDATYNTGSGLLIHVVSISAKHNTVYYNILYFAPDSAYNEAFQKYYAQMLNSFKFS
jgi:hypothetical protein